MVENLSHIAPPGLGVSSDAMCGETMKRGKKKKGSNKEIKKKICKDKSAECWLNETHSQRRAE
jgi:hypothetical protein